MKKRNIFLIDITTTGASSHILTTGQTSRYQLVWIKSYPAERALAKTVP